MKGQLTRGAAAIVGARLGEGEHRADNLRPFAFALDDEDRQALEAAFAATTPIPGDCGDEYRVPPFLTASGDLSHHLGALPATMTATGYTLLVGVVNRTGGARILLPVNPVGRSDRWYPVRNISVTAS